jgi:hypothetical protein
MLPRLVRPAVMHHLPFGRDPYDDTSPLSRYTEQMSVIEHRA